MHGRCLRKAGSSREPIAGNRPSRQTFVEAGPVYGENGIAVALSHDLAEHSGALAAVLVTLVCRFLRKGRLDGPEAQYRRLPDWRLPRSSMLKPESAIGQREQPYRGVSHQNTLRCAKCSFWRQRPNCAARQASAPVPCHGRNPKRGSLQRFPRRSAQSGLLPRKAEVS